MANYVWNKVICSLATLETYFLDPFPLGPEHPVTEPYISFNKMFGVPSLNDYQENIGKYIYYGFGTSCAEVADGLVAIKFCIRWEYPIQAILRILELDHEVTWFAVEENHIYVSKFYWDGGVKEDVLLIDDDAFHEWFEAHATFVHFLPDCDDDIWYYLQTVEEHWKTWESNDNFERYRNKPAHEAVPLLP